MSIISRPLGLRAAAVALAAVLTFSGCAGDASGDGAGTTATTSTSPGTDDSSTDGGSTNGGSTNGGSGDDRSDDGTSDDDSRAPSVGSGPDDGAVAVADPSDGCASTPPALPEPDGTGDVELRTDSGGRTRTYRLGVPADDAGPGPHGLILNLHGSGSNAIQQSVYSELAIHGPKRGYVVITPDAIDGQWELAGEGADDEFLIALIDQISSERCIDLDRVHAAGFSLGSWKASLTACVHQERFASIVLVAEEVAPLDCAMPVVALHGTADAVVPYGSGADQGVEVTGGNAGLPGVEVNMPSWARQAGCSEEKDVERIEPDVERWVYRDCPPGYGVELYSIDGGGHVWPGSPIDVESLGSNTQTVDATEIALDWFDAHPLQR